jgi:hypothetical protein
MVTFEGENVLIRTKNNNWFNMLKKALLDSVTKNKSSSKF